MTQIPRPETRQESAVRRYLIAHRFDASLVFANVRTFGERVQALAEDWRGLHWMVIAAEPLTDVDTNRVGHAPRTRHLAEPAGVSPVFAEMKDPVRKMIERYELTRTMGPAHFFPTMGDAASADVDPTGAAWQRPAP